MDKPEPDTTRESPPARSPLSVERLRQAFSQMLGNHPSEASQAGHGQAAPSEPIPAACDQVTDQDACPIGPQSIVEAMLFVGRPDNRPLTAREMAAAMREVSPDEVKSAVAALNDVYQSDGAPYEIVSESSGFRLVLRDDFSRMRDKFHGRVREAKVSAEAMEVLSIVAYHQPVTLESIDRLRGTASEALLRSLVRRELVRLERPGDRSRSPEYYTTARFLKLFGLKRLDELPRNAELEAA